MPLKVKGLKDDGIYMYWMPGWKGFHIIRVADNGTTFRFFEDKYPCRDLHADAEIVKLPRDYTLGRRDLDRESFLVGAGVTLFKGWKFRVMVSCAINGTAQDLIDQLEKIEGFVEQLPTAICKRFAFIDGTGCNITVNDEEEANTISHFLQHHKYSFTMDDILVIP